MDYQHFGLLAFGMLMCGLGLIIWRWPQGAQLTFSQHIAARRVSIFYYVLLFSAVLPLLLLFFFGWFIPKFELSIWFGIFIALSAATQWLCTLVPEVGGRKTTYHRLLAGVSALSLLPALALLGLARTMTLVNVVLITASLVVMISIVGVLFKNKGQHRYFLILQSAYFLAFFFPVLFVSYV